RDWQPLPALFAAVLAVALNVRAILATGAGSGRGRTLVVLVPLAIMAWVIGYALKGTLAFLYVTLAAWAVFALADWLGSTDAEAGAGRLRIRADVGLLAALLVLGGAILAFRLPALGSGLRHDSGLHGYGIALAALAGLVILTLLPARADAEAG